MMMTEVSTASSHPAGEVRKMNRIVDLTFNLQERMLLTSIPICAVGLIGNGAIFWLLCCKVKIKLSLYFFSVTVANLLIIFCNFVIIILYFAQITPRLIFQRVMQILHICGYDTSFYMFTGVAVERCCSIYFPDWYRSHRPNNFSHFGVSILWGLSFMVSFVDYYACFPRFQINFHVFFVACRTSTIMEIIIELIIFFPIIFSCTLAIWIRIPKRKEGTLRARLDITIVAMVLLFLILNAPLRIAHILTFWIHKIDTYMLQNISLLMDSLNSTCNPLVYFFVGNWEWQKSSAPIHAFLEKALKAEESKPEGTERGQAQA
ncbi:proto-oncogene Mas-like [Varanus komodoensis]|nr:proto-oncogene Mas-like [Varanus komodoensis]